MGGTAAESSAWVPNIRLVALPARFDGARSIIQLWITGRTAKSAKPSTETAATTTASF